MDTECPNCNKELNWEMKHLEYDDTDVGGGYSSGQEYKCKCECGVEGSRLFINSSEGSSYSYILSLGNKVYKEVYR